MEEIDYKMSGDAEEIYCSRGVRRVEVTAPKGKVRWKAFNPLLEKKEIKR